MGSDLHFVALTRRRYCDLPEHSNLEYSFVEAKIYSLKEQIVVPWKSKDFALLHAVHYNFPLLHRGPLVITIHDLTPLMFPELLPHRLALIYARAWLSRAVRQARRIITVSDFTKQQLMKLLGAPENKIRVIHSGVSFPPPEVINDPGIASSTSESKYVLFVGNLKPHKNLQRLIQAFARVCHCHSLDHRLVIAGAGPQDPWKEIAIRENVAGRIDFLGAVDNRSLWNLYRSADLFVMPSLSEGFGFPALEALRCGTPVAAANAGSLPEILAEAAVYFDPYSVEEIAQCLWRSLESDSLRAHLRLQGAKQVRKFDWERTAKRHVEVYREAISG